MGFRHAPFTLAFFGGLVAFGAIGVWIELYWLLTDPGTTGLGGLRSAVSTFFPAIFCSVALQMTFEDGLKAVRGIGVSAALLSIAVFAMMWDHNLAEGSRLAIGLLATSGSLWLWCAANGGSQSYRERAVDAPLGDIALDATLQGDFKGIKH